MKYFITKLGTIIDENNNRVDLIEGTENYNNYVKFLQAGGTLEETENLSVEDLLLLKEVPEIVSKRQLKQALVLAEIPLANIDYAISQIPDEKEKQLMEIFWNDSTEFERNHPKLIEFATALGLSTTQADDLFINASKL